MTDVVGGGVAPGRRGVTVKKTDVRRMPMWVPWDNGGKGSWRLVPADTAHSAQLITTRHEGDRPVKDAEPLYQGKGFIPERFAQEHIPALVEKAQDAIAKNAARRLPAPDWALGVLGRYPDLVSKAKRVDADAA